MEILKNKKSIYIFRGRHLIIRNEEGYISSLGLILALLIFMTSLSLIKYKIDLLHRTKNIGAGYLCTKEYTGEYRDYFKKIKKINHLIFLLNTAKKASLFIPGYGIISSTNIKNVEKGFITAQNLLHVSNMKFLAKLSSRGCSFTATIYKTAFEHSGVTLKRDQFNRAIARDNPWNIYLLKKDIRLKIQHLQQESIVHEI